MVRTVGGSRRRGAEMVVRWSGDAETQVRPGKTMTRSDGLHQTVIVAISNFVVRWDWPSGLWFAAIAVASFALSLLLYELAVRRRVRCASCSA